MESNILPLEAVSWWYAVTAVLATAIHADGRRLVRLFGRRSGKPQILKDYNGRLQLSDLRCGMAAWMAVTSTATTTGKRIGNAMSGRRRHRQSDPLGFFARAFASLTMSRRASTSFIRRRRRSQVCCPPIEIVMRRSFAFVFYRCGQEPIRGQPLHQRSCLLPHRLGDNQHLFRPVAPEFSGHPHLGGQPVAGQSRYEPVSEVSADGEAASKCRRRLARATFQTYWRPG